MASLSLRRVFILLILHTFQGTGFFKPAKTFSHSAQALAMLQSRKILSDST
jgi:hypothetical protein